MSIQNKVIGFFLKQKINRITKDLSPYNLNREILLELLNTLKIKPFSHYLPVVGLVVYLDVRYFNIDLYVKKIIATNNLLSKGDFVPVNWDSATPQLITLDRFLIADEHYVDVQKNIASFKKQCILLCELMESSDDADYGLPEHNKRMLIKLFNNLIEITKALLQASIEI